MEENQPLNRYKQLLGKVRELPKPRIYHNSTNVTNIGGVDLTVWDVLTASVIGNLNALIIGERGEGKTQLLNELKDGFFGGRATYIRMRDNLRAKDLYEVYDKEKLFERKGRISDAKELTDAVKNALTIIDEINRAHEKIQNQVFDIYDGYIVFEGSKGPIKINLGIKVDDGLHYHTAIASANVGSERYHGTSPLDPALLDRAHLILNVDNYSAGVVDNAVIIGETRSAGLLDYENSDKTEQIVQIYKGIQDVRLSFDALTALLYLKKGLESCIHTDNPSKSKLPILSVIPQICEGCPELGDGCGYITPISVRTEKALVLLSKALKVVADSKKSENEIRGLRVNYQDVLSAFSLVGPYSSILDENWVRKEFMGNQQFGINTVARSINRKLLTYKRALKEGFMEATKGKLSAETKRKFNGRWGWYGDLLVKFDELGKKHGDLIELDSSELEEIVKEEPLLQWLK